MTQTTVDSGPEPNVREDQILTFDDVPLYSHVILRGESGFVLEKGTHVSDVSDGRHLLISFAPNSSREDQSVKLHEKLINTYLYKPKNLFVDFADSIPYGAENQSDIPLPDEVR